MAPGDAVTAGRRAGVVHVLGFLGGAVLFFLVFAAIFNGLWPLLIVFVLCYAAAGALGVRVGGALPANMATALVIAAVPWTLWLFPASVLEAGLLRALLWPGLVAVAWGIAWLGGRTAMVARTRTGRR